jgi:hypothetical protein
MKDRSTSLFPALLLAVLQPLSGAEAASPVFPLKASADGRYLVDQRNQPFFYHADTAWQLGKRLRISEVLEYLDDVKRRGFTAIQMMPFWKGDPPLANADGVIPFDPPDDILRPVEAYWRSVDRIVEEAAGRGLVVGMAPLWIRWGGKDPFGWRYQLTSSNARSYGRFLAQRYRHFRNILWILGGDANPIERTRAIAEIALGIREYAPEQLITVHNKEEYASAAFFDTAPWLGINFAYTYRETYIQALGEYNRLERTRPIILGESRYEGEGNERRFGDPYRIRRQVYQAVLGGALGGHAYGHRDIWRFDSDWREALAAPGRRQMAHVTDLFATRAWHKLEPDQFDRLVIQGRGYFGEMDYVGAARTPDGNLAIVYLPQAKSITLDLSTMLRGLKAKWFDPASGVYFTATSVPAPDQRGQRFTPPSRNSGGDADFALVIER